MEKAAIRKQIKAILAKLSQEEIKQRSTLIAAKLFQTAWWREAEVVLAFVSMQGEVETSEMIRTALREGKMIGLPRIAGNDLVFHQIRQFDLHAEFFLNPFGIYEPRPSLPVIEFAQVHTQNILIITPGLAFDRSKNRLGRGKGFYDRFLLQTREVCGQHVVAIGICLSEQLLDYVPVGDHDQPVDGAVTEEEII